MPSKYVKKISIVGGVILLVIVVGMASGALKFKGSVSVREGQPSSSPPAQPAEQPEAPPATKTYENTGLGLTLAYPEGWSLKENPAAGVAVAFGSPKENPNDTFVDNVNVSVSDLASQPRPGKRIQRFGRAGPQRGQGLFGDLLGGKNSYDKFADAANKVLSSFQVK